MLQVNIDFEKEPVGISKDGKEVYFRDIWPTTEEISEVGTVTYYFVIFIFIRSSRHIRFGIFLIIRLLILIGCQVKRAPRHV